MAATVMISIKVEDFAKWKKAFDAAAPMRGKMGIQIKGIYQSADDEKQISLVSEYPSFEAAKAILESPVWQEKQKESGVIGGFDVKYFKHIS